MRHRQPACSYQLRSKERTYIKAYYPELPAQAFVHYGNFIGETLKIADKLKLPRVTLGVMIAKP